MPCYPKDGKFEKSWNPASLNFSAPKGTDVLKKVKVTETCGEFNRVGQDVEATSPLNP
jgi:hypothetical protein